MKDINFFEIKDSYYFKLLNRKEDILRDEGVFGYLIDSGEKEARRIIDSLKEKNKKIGVLAIDDTFNRKAVEKMKIDYFVLNHKHGRDSLKQRDSGLNHVLARIIKKNNITLIIDCSEFRTKDLLKRSEIVSRVIQNLKIVRKIGCKIKFASLAYNLDEVMDQKMRQSIILSLGGSTTQGKEGVEF